MRVWYLYTVRVSCVVYFFYSEGNKTENPGFICFAIHTLKTEVKPLARPPHSSACSSSSTTGAPLLVRIESELINHFPFSFLLVRITWPLSLCTFFCLFVFYVVLSPFFILCLVLWLGCKATKTPPLRWREASNCFTNRVFCLPGFSLARCLPHSLSLGSFIYRLLYAFEISKWLCQQLVCIRYFDTCKKKRREREKGIIISTQYRNHLRGPLYLHVSTRQTRRTSLDHIPITLTQPSETANAAKKIPPFSQTMEMSTRTEKSLAIVETSYV